MRRNVSISRNRTKIERLLDLKEFPSKYVGRFSFQCMTAKQCIYASLGKICRTVQKIIHRKEATPTGSAPKKYVPSPFGFGGNNG